MAKALLKTAIRIRKTVPSLTTVTIDTVLFVNFRGLRYFVTSWNGTKSKVFDFTVRNINNTSVDDSVFGRLGDLPLSIKASVSGSGIIVEVTNPNAFAITVEVLKFLMGV